MPFAYDLTGTLLDRRYELTGLLGKGGMGHVYDARHVALEQRVAIKVLHPRYAHEERFRERFIREARSASRIKHDNVVRISDFGDTPDGSVYFAMDFLEGHDLGVELKKTKKMKWPRVRHILSQAASALHAAHSKDIIHRDIKPANCFLTVDKEAGVVDVVKLLDFGIAKVGSDSHADAQGKGLTGTGEVFGTVAYMSPEQAAGGELDPRSDIYSLGVMAYEMLTGTTPFKGVNSIHVITQHLQDPPKPPRSHDPTIPEPVQTLVLRMLAKSPSGRHESMGDLEDALRSIPESIGQQGRRRTRVWDARSRTLTASGTTGGDTIKKNVVSQVPTKHQGSEVALATGTQGAELDTEEETAVDRARPSGLGISKTNKKKLIPSAPDLPLTPASREAIAARAPVGSPRHGTPSGMTVSVALRDPDARANGLVESTLEMPVEPEPAIPGVARVLHTSHPTPAVAGIGSQGDTGPSQKPEPSAQAIGSAIGQEHRSTGPMLLTGTSSTGPVYPGGADSSIDTSPHAPARTQTVFSAKTIVALAILVLVVSVGSVVGTLLWLSQRASENEVEARVDPPTTRGERRRPDESTNAIEDVGSTIVTVPADTHASTGEPAQPSGLGRDTDLTDPPVAPPAGGGTADETATVPERVEGLEAERPEDAPASQQSPTPTETQKPTYETEKCARTRMSAHENFENRRWKSLAELARRKSCWSRSQQSDRLGMYLMALLELERFEDCIKAGQRSKAPAVTKLMKICTKRAEQ